MTVDITTDTRTGRFVQFGWATLYVTVAVIVWGAVVRATGSGAGCGSHWPLCNGEVVPPAPTTKTIIEFTHRLTSGVAMLLSLGLLVGARRLFGAGHPARRWAMAAFVFMMIEAAVGAGLVLLGLVEDDTSALRAGYIAVHLVNTMLLVGAITGTIKRSGSGTAARVRVADRPRSSDLRRLRGLTLVLMILVAALGAVVALGDTLFPHASVAEGLAADFDPTSHFLIRLRVWHPALAAITGAMTIYAFRASTVTVLVLLQAGLGLLNLAMLAPLGLQLAHLAGSNALWIVMVWAWLDDAGVATTPAVP